MDFKNYGNRSSKIKYKILLRNTLTVYCATREKKIYFASVKLDAQAKRE